jgi:diguanylate cyclase (GGDEF)-like protein/PAS domain S-box-containing protein
MEREHPADDDAEGRLSQRRDEQDFDDAGASALLRHIADAVLCADVHGTILYCNDAAESLFELPRAALIGLPAADIVSVWPPATSPPPRAAAEAFARRGSGALVPVEISFGGMAHPAGRRIAAVIRDISDRKANEDRLIEAQLKARLAEAEARAAHIRLREAIEMLPEAIVFLDAEDRYVLSNRRYAELYADIADLLVPGMPFVDILRASLARGEHPETVDDPEAWLEHRMTLHRNPRGKYEQQFRDGRWMRHEERRTTDGGTIGVRVDITDLKRREASFRLLFDANPVPMLVFAADNLAILAVNDAAVEYYGFGRPAFLRMTMSELNVTDERAGAETALRAGATGDREWRHTIGDGREVAVLVFVRTLTYEGAPACLAAVVDVTERLEAEARIAYLADHDPLTGLANRSLFRRHLDAALARLGPGERLALLWLDLDDFKDVNDSFGHPAGDVLLQLVAERIRAAASPGDLAARLGGDEFAIVSGPTTTAAAEAAARRLVAAFRVPFDLAGRSVSVGASIGIALAPDDGSDSESLVALADAALYRSKRTGKPPER